MNSTSPNCTASYPSVFFVRRCVTTHGPACKTVHGTAVPSSAKTCVIPSLIPSIPLTPMSVALSFSPPPETGGNELLPAALLGAVFAPKRLDFDVHARRQIQLHQRVHRIRGGLED